VEGSPTDDRRHARIVERRRRVVKAEIEIAATPARVFQSLTDANELAAWWGSDDM
jgi:uncharacterized protein YndB with AHSA1/START domain